MDVRLARRSLIVVLHTYIHTYMHMRAKEVGR